MDGRPNRRNKTAFSNYSGVVRTGPKSSRMSSPIKLASQPQCIVQCLMPIACLKDFKMMLVNSYSIYHAIFHKIIL